MKKYLLLLLASLSFAFAQYTPISTYLQTPDKFFGYVDSCGKLWKKAYDPAYGGFYMNIDQMGNVKTSWGTNKNMLNQSRDAYGFTRAFQLTGDTSYLRYARYALSFMTNTAWDAAYGGWYNSVSRTGSPTSPTDNKTAYYQHYALVGLVAYYEAVRDTSIWSWIAKSYQYNDTHLWDTSASTFGYYDKVQYTGNSPSGKSFNATVDAVTTHLSHLYMMTGDATYKTRLLQVADNMINRLAASAPQQAIGFVELYTSSWAPDNSQTMTIMGHVLKTAWCLARMYELEHDSLYLATAEQLVSMVLTKGYDHDFGGPYKDYNRQTGAMLMWGQTDTAKAWWQMEQAITAGLVLYHITNDVQYLQMADETMDFFMKYFVDHVYGDVFSDRTRYGNQIWGLEKGSDGKAGYHSIETGYYGYIYGNLFFKNEPITLFYNFNAEGQSRTLRMRPVEMADGMLSIAGVTLNGIAYGNYHGTNLTIPAGTGGIFAVTYQNTPPVGYGVSVSLSAGWNLISVPVQAADRRKSTLFPSAVSSAFSYEGSSSYQPRDTLTIGKGYWLKYDSTRQVVLNAPKIYSDTIPIEVGWNLIGSVGNEVPVASIVTNPPGILTSNFFSYARRYTVTDTISPGFGYWVYAYQAGELFLTADTASNKTSRLRIAASYMEPPSPPEVEASDSRVPVNYSLSQNYPNPFNPSTVIRYSLPVSSSVIMKVYNTLGEEVAMLVNEQQDAGYQSIEWSPVNLSSGVYFYRIEATDVHNTNNAFVQVRKMVFIK